GLALDPLQQLGPGHDPIRLPDLQPAAPGQVLADRPRHPAGDQHGGVGYTRQSSLPSGSCRTTYQSSGSWGRFLATLGSGGSWRASRATGGPHSHLRGGRWRESSVPPLQQGAEHGDPAKETEGAAAVGVAGGAAGGLLKGDPVGAAQGQQRGGG